MALAIRLLLTKGYLRIVSVAAVILILNMSNVHSSAINRNSGVVTSSVSSSSTSSSSNPSLRDGSRRTSSSSVTTVVSNPSSGFSPAQMDSTRKTVLQETVSVNKKKRRVERSAVAPPSKVKTTAGESNAGASAAGQDKQLPLCNELRRKSRSTDHVAGKKATKPAGDGGNGSGLKSKTVGGRSNAKKNETDCIFTPDQFFTSQRESKKFAEASNKKGHDNNDKVKAEEDAGKLASALASNLMKPMIIEHLTLESPDFVQKSHTASTDFNEDEDSWKRTRYNDSIIFPSSARLTSPSGQHQIVVTRPENNTSSSSNSMNQSATYPKRQLVSGGKFVGTNDMSSNTPVLISNPNLPPKERPGQCLENNKNQAWCVVLGPNDKKCMRDADCPGTKKCCFLSCSPFEDVGICDVPALL